MNHSSAPVIRASSRVIVAWCLAVLSAAVSCTSSSLSSTTPSTNKCEVTAKGTGSSIAAGGGTATVSVIAPPECTWKATTDASWIMDVTPSAGQGNRDVQLRIAPNTVSVARSATVHIGAVDVQITQDAAALPCVFQVTPPARSFNAGGGTSTIAVSADSACAWTATSTQPWITISSGASGAGNGVVTIAVAANTGTARTGQVTVAGQTVAVTQSAPDCSILLNGTTQTVAAAGGPAAPVTVTTGTSCGWTTVSNASWITVTSGASATGSGAAAFTVAPNSGAERTGTLTIGGQTYTVIQAGSASPVPPPVPPPATCSFAITPTSSSIGAAGANSVSVAVTTTSSCSWTAVSNDAWISITSGTSGTGNGAVQFRVAANSGSAPRTGTMTIAGQTFTVSQAVVCTYQINPTTQTLALTGGTGSIAVTAPVSCAWTAVSNADWITVTGGASGSGNGTVTYSAAATTNNKNRNGTITIASETFIVDESK
jgi:hypothetical protein